MESVASRAGCKARLSVGGGAPAQAGIRPGRRANDPIRGIRRVSIRFAVASTASPAEPRSSLSGSRSELRDSTRQYGERERGHNAGPRSSFTSSESTVTLFILFPVAPGPGIVAPDFLPGALK